MLKDLLKPKIDMTDLAQEYGCSPAYVSMVANGKREASPRFKVFCAQKFGLPIDVLFPETKEKGGESIGAESGQ